MARARLCAKAKHGGSQKGALNGGGPGDGNPLGPEPTDHVQDGDWTLVLRAGPARCFVDESDVSLEQIAGPDACRFDHGEQVGQPSMHFQGDGLPEGDGKTQQARRRASPHIPQDPGNALRRPGFQGPGDPRLKIGEERGRLERFPAE